MADYLNPQDLANAKVDAKTLGEAVNDKKIIKPRYGDSYKSIPMISADGDRAISELKTAIDIALAAGAGAAGWNASLVLDDSGLTQQEINDSTLLKIPSIKDFGAKYDGNSDEFALTNAMIGSDYVLINSGTTLIPTFRAEPNKHIVGIGRPTVNVDPKSITPVSVQVKAGATVENIKFNSVNNNVKWQYVAMQDNTAMINCGVHNFGDQSQLPDSWGILLTKCTNVTLDRIEFSGNSQADIAMTDDVRNVTIINPRHSENSVGVKVNLEPNDVNTIEGVNIIGGTYRNISLLENHVLSNAIRGVVVAGATIYDLSYRGGGGSFIGCDIKKISTWINTYIYCGQLKIDNATLSENLMVDPYLSDIGLGGNTAWGFYEATGNEVYRRVHSASDGSYTLLNPDLNTTPAIISNRRIDVIDDELLVISISRNVITQAGFSGWNAGAIEFFASDDSSIRSIPICTNRAPLGSNVGWCNDVGVVQVPLGSAYAIVTISCPMQVQVQFRHAGVYRIRLNQTSGNFNTVIEMSGLPVHTRTYRRERLPAGIRLNTYNAGDVIELNLKEISAGSMLSYVCSAPSSWGGNATWLPLVVVPAPQTQ